MNYDKAWEKVDHLNDKGLPQSAAEEVKKIYNQAKKERDEGQLTKALIYQINLGVGLSDSGAEEALVIIESEIKAASVPLRYILQSVAANMYWQYLQNNRWRLYNRSSASGIDQADIGTWSLSDLHHRISKLFLASIADTALLQQTSLTPFEPAIIKGNTRNLRPTLYDLLAHRALDYFENDEKDIVRPAYAFSINENAALDPVADFVRHPFSTPDTASLHFKALLIYQNLLAFHSRDSGYDALMDVDLRRLQFVYRYATQPEKDTVYRLALEHLISQYNHQPITARAMALLAQYYFQQGTKYDKTKGKEDLKYAFQKAKEICQQAIAAFPKTEAAINCSYLLSTILKKSLALKTEAVNIPGEAFRTLVSYKNLSSCYFRVIPVNNSLRNQWSYSDEANFWQRLAAVQPTKSWQQQLPKTDDYRQHSVEIKIDALPVGTYILLGSADPKFETGKNLLSAQLFYVSDISYINEGEHYFVLHRNTGQPLQEATVQVWTSKYDYSTRKTRFQKTESFTTNQYGFFELKSEKNSNRSIRLEIKWKNDYLFMLDEQYQYFGYNPEELSITEEDFEQKNAQLYFFTDRAIYRPGQIVYFKGIGITKDAKSHQSKLITQKQVTVILKDVHNQKLDSLALTLSDFGSVQGQFRLPQNVLTGNFKITAEDFNQSNILFSVEEYKRPTFEVDIQKPEQSYRLRDTVTVNGTVRAYAGNQIDGAAVKYRVFRKARFLFPWLYYRQGLPNTSSMEITNGITTTDAQGKFTISFAAIPDLSVSEQLQPVFDYTIEANVTDISGETRSKAELVQVGYTALQLNIDLPEDLPVDSFRTVSVISKNFNGGFESVKTQIEIFPLKNPDRLIRSRFWETPDLFIYNEKEFITFFPHDEFKNEADYRNWEKGEAIYSGFFTTGENIKLPITNLPFIQGYYCIEATTKDRYGSEVKAVAYLQLYDNKSNALPAPVYNWSTSGRQVIEPGQTTSFFIGSSANDVFVIHQTEKRDDKIPVLPKSSLKDRSKNEFRYYVLNQGKKQLSYTATEEDRGGFGSVQVFVKHNRFYVNTRHISVPWNNKELNVELSTFRNKMEPGSMERWEVKIRGNKSEKISAEMVAAMYDASLDQFRPHQWQVPYVWPVYYRINNWRGEDNFSLVSSQSRNNLEDETGYPEEKLSKSYDQLIDVKFNGLNEVIVTGYGVRKAIRFPAKREASGFTPPAVAYDAEEQNKLKESVADSNGIIAPPSGESNTTPSKGIIPAVRKDFNETAFFLPNLRTDSSGNISFGFTMPEVLTQWKLMALAHSRQLAFGYTQHLAVTQKELMIQPNIPRFVREKDSLILNVKVVNMGDSLIGGFATLELFNARTGKVVDEAFKNMQPVKSFLVPAAQSSTVQFEFLVPKNFNDLLRYRVSAISSPNAKGIILSDGEENLLPVLSNRMLITETLPLTMRDRKTKQFRFESLLHSGKLPGSSLKNYALTVEYTPNPVWLAIQSLPYLTEYPYECSEQTFNRYYANIMAAHIARSAPRIRTVYEQWRNDSSKGGSQISTLEKNQELKSILLEETPWVLQAKNETEQKKNMSLLFDMFRMEEEASTNLKKLLELQVSNGGFVWFKGGRDDRYITQYILSGVGHLQQLGLLSKEFNKDWNNITFRALDYADQRIMEEYNQLIKQKADLKKNQLTSTAIQYLYMRSFFKSQKVNAASRQAYNYFMQQAKKYWLSESKYFQGMIALILYREGDQATANAILKSLKENAIRHEELGMYWKTNTRGFYWYEAPVETQALLIEAFHEIANDSSSVQAMQLWLLKQKQTQHWGNTRATAEACYALLLQGTSNLNDSSQVTIQMGDRKFSSSENVEAGTGYYKHSITADAIVPGMGNIKVEVSPTEEKRNNPGWGAVYWQYFEDIDKVKAGSENNSPLQLKKQFFVEGNTDKGPVLFPVTDDSVLKTGDKIRVRIELRADRDMEYLHMKDLRPAAFEPVNVLSRYYWQDGLGYYESTRDAATHFFFSRLRKGVYVFEYPLFVTQKGDFSAGVASIQCMYAPEFTSHSEGVRIRVE